MRGYFKALVTSSLAVAVLLFLQLATARADSGYIRVHDPSTVVKQWEDFWLFSTGIGVKSLHSTNLADWQPGPPVFTNVPAWVRQIVPDHRGHFWAPDVIWSGGRWLLFYSVSSWGKNNSAIGLASNETLDPRDARFLWRDEGMVVHSFRTNNFNAIDPAAFLDADGKLWLTFGSFWSGIKLVELDPVTGKRIAPESPICSLAWYKTIEAPFIHRHGTNYFLFVNWGLCCREEKSTYEIRVGRSTNVAGPYLDRAGVDMRKGGGTLLLGSEGPFIGPGHAGIVNVAGQDWLSFHFYDGLHGGQPTLAFRKLNWLDDGWPVITDEPIPVRAGKTFSDRRLPD